MAWIWNLFFDTNHKVGECDGDCKQDVERVAREELGYDVDVDLQREPVEVPERKGWWNSN